MYKFEKQFRGENPQTIGETDRHFDLDNYKDWLELKLTQYMELNNPILKINPKIIDITDDLNRELLTKWRVSTNPDMLFFMSYDSYDIEKNETPLDSLCRYTVRGLKHIFPLLKVEIRDEYKLYVENNLIDFNPIPAGDHDEYIKKIMEHIFLLYDGDETKLPKKLYKWRYQNK